MKQPIVTVLDSGYWHVRWSAEIWAQWPNTRPVQAEDFFAPSWTATPERVRLCDQLTKGHP